MGRFKNFLSRFKREKEQEFVKPTAWKSKEELEAEMKEKKAQDLPVKKISIFGKFSSKRLKFLERVKVSVKPIPIPIFKVERQVRIPFLLPAKRLLAGILFLINLVVLGFSIIVAFSLPLILVFLPNAFILLDYLFKTRKKSKWVKVEEE